MIPHADRPALAPALAALTDRPVGHWRAELQSPAWRGFDDLTAEGVRWRVSTDFARAATVSRFAPWATVPATRHEAAHRLTPDEGLDALFVRDVLPPSWAGDPRRAFACPDCEGRGTVPAVVGGLRVQCLRCAADCPACAGVGRTGAEVCATCGGESIVTDACSPGVFPSPATLGALLAWASLGADGILAAELLARTAADAERASWRALGRTALRAVDPRLTWHVARSREALVKARRARSRVRGSEPYTALFATRAGLAVGSRAMAATLRAPMLELWSRGVALDQIDDRGVILVCAGLVPP